MHYTNTNLGAVLFVTALSYISGSRDLQQVAPAPALGPSQASLTNANLLTATQAVSLLCSRQMTAVQYVTALDNYYTQSGYSCAFPWITYNITQVLADAAAIDAKAAAGQDIRPLCGLPLAVKDSIDVLGYPTTCATPGLAGNFVGARVLVTNAGPLASPILFIKNTNHYPPFSAPLINQYLNANGIILGKANLAEYQGSAINPTGNGVRAALNAYNPTLTTGGSSTGNGPILSTGLAPLALCEDTGGAYPNYQKARFALHSLSGSCRYPSVSSGLFGFRPTLGCYNYSDGLVPYEYDRDTVGSMARTADDLILLDSIVRNSAANSTSVGALDNPISCAVSVNRNLNLTGMRIGLPSTFGWVKPGISAEIAVTVNNALNKLRAAGAILVPVDSTSLGAAAANDWGGVQSGPGPYMVPDAFARYLWTHNYTDTPYDIYSQVNRPDLKTSLLGYLKTYLTSVAGSRENFVNYLRWGRTNQTVAWQALMTNNNLSALLYPAQVYEIAPVGSGDQYIVFRNSSGNYILPRGQAVECSLDAGADVTAGAFPIGFSEGNNSPVGLMVAGPPGYDSTVLSLMYQMNQLFGSFPRPPSVALCQGCIANVSNVPLTFNTSMNALASTLGPNISYTPFALTFADAPGGACNASLLSYGQNGPVGVGPPQNLSIPITTVQGVALPPAAGASSAG